LGVVAALFAAIGSAPAASSSVVVSATVPSATNLDTSGCAPNVAGRTHFGALLPGAAAVTTLDCSIQFGSSNDTARLRARQTDRLGTTMYQPTRGVLDPGFGTGGRVTTATGPGTAYDTAKSIAVQADGKLVTTGMCWVGIASGLDACLARYNLDGTLDTSFDTDGIVTTATAPGDSYDSSNAIAVQTDGKLVTAGTCYMGWMTDNDACLARYNVDGSLDTSFDSDGRVTTATGPGAGDDMAFAIALQPDGRIVTTGYCEMGGATGQDLCVARYNTDGSLDTTFDSDGRVTTGIAPGTGYDGAEGIVLQPDGKIVIAGYCNMGGLSGPDGCLARFDSGGALDVTFDTDGRVSTGVAPGTGADSFHAVTVQTDGKLVASGDCDMSVATGADACLVRYNANGSLDTSFDADGSVTTATAPGAGGDYPRAITVQADGKLVSVGQCDMRGGSGFDTCLARYNADGSLDATFDNDGIVTTATAPGTGYDSALAVAIQADGKLVTAGWCDMGGVATGGDACLAQYDQAGTISQYADTTTDWDTVGTSLFGACLRGLTNATATWVPNATCAASDGTHWNAVPTTSSQIAVADPSQTVSVVQLRFGVRAAPTQPSGSYVAPITFDVIAP